MPSWFSPSSSSYSTPWSSYGKIETVVIQNGVTSISAFSFSSDSLTSVTIPDSVTSIGDYAFQGCSSLTNVTIPDNVTSIGVRAFAFCSSLLSVTIPDKVISIGDRAFSTCRSLRSVTIGNSVTSIGDYAFYRCESLTSVTIPDSVTSIGKYTFAYCYSLTSVTIPDSVTSIGDYAFARCYSLTSVTIPDSVTSIGKYTFAYCNSLTSVTIGNSVTSIGEYTFAYCYSLTSVTIPDSVTSIGNYAFYCCESLTSVTIPDSVTSIGGAAFDQCYYLFVVYVQSPTIASAFTNRTDCGNIIRYANSIAIRSDIAEIGGYVTKNYTHGETLTYLEVEYTVYCKEMCEHDWQFSYVYKSTVCGADGIAIHICSVCNLAKDVVIPMLGHNEIAHEGKAPTCTEGGWNEYVTCSRCDYTTYEELAALGHDETIHEAKAPTCTEYGWNEYVTCSRCDYTTYEEFSALGHDETIHEAKAPTCTEYGWNEYVTCSRCDYTTYEELAALGHDEIAHEGKVPTCTEGGWNEYVTCSRCDYTTYVEIPATGHNYVDGICGNCGAKEPVTAVDSGVTGSLTWVLTSDGTLTISGEGEMPYYSSWHSVPWKNYNKQIIKVIIEHGVTSISSYVFQSSNVVSVYIPQTITNVGFDAFWGCHSLTDVYITDIAAWCNIYYYNDMGSPLKFAENLYLNGELITELVIPEGVTSIGSYSFKNCQALISVTIPNSVEQIGGHAFSGCINLKDVNFSNSTVYAVRSANSSGLISIGNNAFASCESLESIILPDSVTEIGSSAFYYDINLSSIKLSENLISIGYEAFNQCRSLTEIIIPESVTTIYSGAFTSCKSLKSVVLPEGVTVDTSTMFKDCTSLTSVYLPESITSIGSSAFENCHNLISIVIPKNVTSIGNRAFFDCRNLIDITIYSSLSSVDKTSFDYCSSLKTIYYHGSEQEWNSFINDLHVHNDLLNIDDVIFVEDCTYGHNETIHEAKAPTCTEYGWNEYVTCSRCDYTTYEELAALGHEYVNGYCDVCKTFVTGFVTDEGGTRYYYGYGSYAKGLTTIEDKTYYFYSNGYLFEGDSMELWSMTYYFNEDYSVKEGLILDADGYRYYVKGVRNYGWVDTDGDGERDSYFFTTTQLRCEEDRQLFDGISARRFFLYDEATGHMVRANGFYTNEKGTQYFIDGLGAYGWITADGVCITERPGITIADAHYFAYGDGLNFYMVEDSVKTIGGVVREFDENHLVKSYTGWATNKTTGNANYYVNGVMQQGWCETPDGWVYLSRSENLANNITYGDVFYGWRKIGGKVYYFRASTSTPQYTVITDATRQLTYDGVRSTYYINQTVVTGTGADYYITNPPAGF